MPGSHAKIALPTVSQTLFGRHAKACNTYDMTECVATVSPNYENIKLGGV